MIKDIKGNKYIIKGSEGKTVFLQKVNGKVLNVARIIDGVAVSITPLWHTKA